MSTDSSFHFTKQVLNMESAKGPVSVDGDIR